ncbi:MAG: ornithine carbamoyltransferase [Zetaproteobacteria bacterium]|nr:MAG: ornithine carbamoyltransferase [Zetaproteobacteria bacterium]
MRHFLTLLDLTREEARSLLGRASELKRMQRLGEEHRTLAGKTLGLLFDKASTRTRVSFEVGMFHLGGHALFLHSTATQLGRGEPIEDSARVLSRMVDIIAIRTFAHETVQRFAEYASVPVINALTDWTHPCQILADVFTYEEHRGPIEGRTVAWIGDGNNMAHSWINGAVVFGYRLRVASPPGYEPDPDLLQAARALGADVELCADPMTAADQADLVTTDVWASMGQEDEQAERKKAFSSYRVDDAVMLRARHDALFMHCLPAHRGEEVTPSVIDGPQSVVWDEAENRLHVQKALLEFLLQP